MSRLARGRRLLGEFVRAVSRRRTQAATDDARRAKRLLHRLRGRRLDPSKTLELEAHLAENPSTARRVGGFARHVRGDSAPRRVLHRADRARGRLADPVPPAPDHGPRRFTLPRWLIPAAGAGRSRGARVGGRDAGDGPGEDERIATEVLQRTVPRRWRGVPSDVASSDQPHGQALAVPRLPFSAPVSDLSAQAFELTGARLDFVGGRRVAVLAYSAPASDRRVRLAGQSTPS